MKRKAYKSDPLPYSLTHDQYVTGTRDLVYLIDRIEGYVDLKEAMKFLASDDKRTKSVPGYQGYFEYLPAKSFAVFADSAKIMEKNMVSERYAHLVDTIMRFTLNKEFIVKNEVMVLDLLANNDWNRPVYFATSVGTENYVNLENYFQLEGFAYQLVPIRSANQRNRIGMPEYGHVDTDKMYFNVMKKNDKGFILDGFKDPRVYLDENHMRMAYNIRNNMVRLASALNKEGRTEMAVEVLDKAMTDIPSSRIPHNLFSLFVMDEYYEAGEFEKGDRIAKEFAEMTGQELNFFTSLRPGLRDNTFDIQRAAGIYLEILETLERYNREELKTELDEKFQPLSQRLNFFDR
jgi:tetratricopeptide (TPR) repeat protein